MANRFQVLGAFTTFTPALSGLADKKLTLTNNFAGIKAKDITSYAYTAYVAGVNAKFTSISATVVDKETYNLYIPYRIAGGTQGVITATVTADGTSLTNLNTAFANQINGKHLGFLTASVSSTLLVLQVNTLAGYAAGEVLLTGTPRIEVQSTGANFCTWTTTTAQVAPVGDPATIIRQNSGGNDFTGTVNNAATYDVAQIVVAADTLTLYIDNTIANTGGSLGYLDFVKSTIQQYQGILGFAAGKAVSLNPVDTTLANTTDLVPEGAETIAVTGNTAANLIGIIAGQPVNTKYIFVSDTTAFTIKMPAGESLNGGSNGGVLLLSASATTTIEKTGATTWKSTQGIAVPNVAAGVFFSTPTPAAVNTTGNITAAQLITGCITCTAASADATLTLPTTAAIIAACGFTTVGSGFDFTVVNTSAGHEAILVAGTGMTLSTSNGFTTPLTVTHGAATKVASYRIAIDNTSTPTCTLLRLA